MEYPPDWLCKHCGNALQKHIESAARDRKRWCFAQEDANYMNHAYQWFEPMDNLSLVEKLANDRKLS